MQMPKKNKDNPALARAKELFQCEGEILHAFDVHKVTTPEAVFIFERIKFTALLNDANRQASKQIKTQQAMPSGNMFR